MKLCTIKKTFLAGQNREKKKVTFPPFPLPPPTPKKYFSTVLLGRDCNPTQRILGRISMMISSAIWKLRPRIYFKHVKVIKNAVLDTWFLQRLIFHCFLKGRWYRVGLGESIYNEYSAFYLLWIRCKVVKCNIYKGKWHQLNSTKDAEQTWEWVKKFAVNLWGKTLILDLKKCS